MTDLGFDLATLVLEQKRFSTDLRLMRAALVQAYNEIRQLKGSAKSDHVFIGDVTDKPCGESDGLQCWWDHEVDDAGKWIEKNMIESQLAAHSHPTTPRSQSSISKPPMKSSTPTKLDFQETLSDLELELANH